MSFVLSRRDGGVFGVVACLGLALFAGGCASAPSASSPFFGRASDPSSIEAAEWAGGFGGGSSLVALRSSWLVPLIADEPVPSLSPRDVTGKFACPMHPEEISDSAGRCSVCGMELEPIDSKEPNHERHHDHGSDGPR